MTSGNGGPPPPFDLAVLLEQQRQYLASLRRRARRTLILAVAAVGVFGIINGFVFALAHFPFRYGLILSANIGAVAFCCYIAGMVGGEFRTLNNLHHHMEIREKEE